MAEDAKYTPHIGIGPSQPIHMVINLPEDADGKTVCGLYMIYEDVFGDIHEDKWVLRSKDGDVVLAFTQFENGDESKGK